MNCDVKASIARQKCVALVCHDAGGANLAHSFIANNLPKNLKIFVEGPAVKIFAGCFQNAVRAPDISSLLDGADALISSTGWASNVEFDARQLAKKRGIKSISIIDHWINYPERFSRHGENVIPDEIWVSDVFAERIAKREFPLTPVRLIRNYYLEDLVSQINSSQSEFTREILYVLEPARHKWGRREEGEFQALDFFLNKLDSLSLGAEPKVVLRPHPSDLQGKYDDWITHCGRPNIEVEQSGTSLVDSISQTKAVVGCESFALVVALAAGRKVYCSLPPWAPACRLPHDGLVYLSEL
jgi:hypothetical protein